MPSLDDCYADLVDALARQEGPARSATNAGGGWASVIQTALARTSGDKRAGQIVNALEEAGIFDQAALAGTPAGEIRDTLQQAGVAVTSKIAALIRRLAEWFTAAFSDPAGLVHDVSATAELRAGLLAINGIGQGTADAILLALGRPVCPIDPGSYRILVRHGWCDITADYDEASDCLSRHAGNDPAEIDRLIRGLSDVGRRYCGLSVPKCDRCPLAPLLPESGPIDPHG